ncbi:11965_t:CDS:1, partial [Diversispora eburnea]
LSERSKNENNNFEIYSNTSYNELHDPELFVFNQEGYNNAYKKLENEIIQQLDDNRDDIDLLEDTEAITIESTNAEESDKTIII